MKRLETLSTNFIRCLLHFTQSKNTNRLTQVNTFAEGEAARYFEHAQTLRTTIERLRRNNEMDLIRCESLSALDSKSLLRLLQKNYMFACNLHSLFNSS